MPGKRDITLLPIPASADDLKIAAFKFRAVWDGELSTMNFASVLISRLATGLVVVVVVVR